MTLRFLTAGESHGPRISAILDGLPAGLALDRTALAALMARRQAGFGTGGRMAIERDAVSIHGGVLGGLTTGAPVGLTIENLDFAAWADRDIPPLTTPRPGHADLSAAVKYGYGELRLSLERASARETAARVAVGGLCLQLLAHFGVTIGSYVTRIGRVTVMGLPEATESRSGPGRDRDRGERAGDGGGHEDGDGDGHGGDEEIRRDVCHDPLFDEPDARAAAAAYRTRFATADADELRCYDAAASAAMRTEIQQAIKARDTLGGCFEVVALGVPPGLGSHVQWDRRLTGRLLAAITSVPSVKGAELGPAFENATRRGTLVHDRFILDDDAHSGETVIGRAGNRGGGLEGGITTGAPVILRAAMKPISTTLSPLASVDLATGKPAETAYERSDFCSVPRAGVIGEAMVAFVLADALLAKVGGDSIDEIAPRIAALRRGRLSELPMDNVPWRFGYDGPVG